MGAVYSYFFEEASTGMARLHYKAREATYPGGPKRFPVADELVLWSVRRHNRRLAAVLRCALCDALEREPMKVPKALATRCFPIPLVTDPPGVSVAFATASWLSFE